MSSVDVPSDPLRILLVDDEPLVLSVYELLLGREFKLAFARSAEEALGFIEAGAFDVVICDYQMAGHDGIWLLEQVRNRCPGTLRVLTSGGNVPHLSVHKGGGLVQHFLAKPALYEDIVACLERARLPVVDVQRSAP